MSKPQIPFLIRDPKGDDLAFILNSWLMSERDLWDHRFMSQSVYFSGFRAECVRKLEDGFVQVACNPDDDNQIYGWVCATDSAIHYVYVKQPFRGYGISKALIRECVKTDPVVVTTAGRFHRDWASKHGIVYDPYSWKAAQ